MVIRPVVSSDFTSVAPNDSPDGDDESTWVSRKVGNLNRSNPVEAIDIETETWMSDQQQSKWGG